MKLRHILILIAALCYAFIVLVIIIGDHDIKLLCEKGVIDGEICQSRGP